ncbi:serine hydrolase [Lysinibacillus sp. KCTC 33748]|uniref:serine hydrolase domain-containing protein n=1 Tax=unclassified Lysinibacillus TaxID=2636778 RepID=UPI0009A78242|nr:MULTISPECIES: serine hydrolase domain-containing protein [unclassified Lysinibacillus]OXS68514.1 serine hydrolase [Lysinibacillus sp. KCTC 33748]SKC10416.1 CubicO group peptidase, beta-lactamase class C family [Lysinibacillus sp. AC-3]
MKALLKIYLSIIVTIVAFYSLTPTIVNADANEKTQMIDQFIQEQKVISKIPGISLVIVEKGKTVYEKGFGYADVQSKTPVTSNTLFELGSTSKAFTGHAILKLEKEGLLKRSDDVRKYIPWLELEYNGEPRTITINQLLYHTSGIATNTITNIPKSNEENALELTVKNLLDQPLNRQPGSSFEYATVNYDVLGLVIEKVSKQPFDMYIKQHILEPINMKDSFVGLHQVESNEMASGYKIGLMREQEYTPPIYRGNIPAGYIISNTNDIANWLKLQLGNSQINAIENKIIQESHIPDQSVEPFDTDTYYASGWGVRGKEDKKQYIFHAGENPTFSSYFIMQPDEQIGVAVLSNMNSSYTTAIGQGVMDLWEGKTVNTIHADNFQNLDKTLSLICVIVVGFGMFLSVLLLQSLQKVIKKQRIIVALNMKRALLLVFHSLSVAIIIALIMMFPKVLPGGSNWEFIKVWGPTSITVLFYSVIVSSVIYYLVGLIKIFTKKEKN